ncbi:MAG: hypothetical protein JXL84_12365, partial [Deltaproteobacteria bacterium]|nr:hypothetical protein [Deltaproteobacteria bacterium]
LKSWMAEVFRENGWKRVLHLTCDFLPGDHTFSIYVKEGMNANGEITQSWYAISGNGPQGPE